MSKIIKKGLVGILIEARNVTFLIWVTVCIICFGKTAFSCYYLYFITDCDKCDDFRVGDCWKHENLILHPDKAFDPASGSVHIDVGLLCYFRVISVAIRFQRFCKTCGKNILKNLIC